MTRDACRARVLAAMPGTPWELAERAFVSESTARRWVRLLRAEPVPACHIVKWTRTKGRATPKHAAGPGPDARMPKKLSQAQYCRNSRTRAKKALKAQQAVQAKHDLLIQRAEQARQATLARQTAERAAERAARAPNSWLAALGVAA